MRYTPFTRYNRLSNLTQPVVQPVNRLYNRLTGCTTGLTTVLNEQPLFNRFDNRLNVCIHDTTGCQAGLTTGLTAVVSCKRGFTTLRHNE